jgi:hypothetical protein
MGPFKKDGNAFVSRQDQVWLPTLSIRPARSLLCRGAVVRLTRAIDRVDRISVRIFSMIKAILWLSADFLWVF